jgi:glycine cleavage system H protein
VYADIKVAPGEFAKQGDLVAVVESVKASSAITAPISGKVLEINNQLNSSPELINAEPYTAREIFGLKDNPPVTFRLSPHRKV